MNIQKPDKTFNFKNISLETPNSVQGGSWITKILNNDEKLYIQTNECSSKQGFVDSGKKTYIDLLFDQKDSEFIEWTENLEDKLVNLIYEKSDVWFENSLGKSDIESAFSPLIRSFRSGKNYLLRVNINNKLINDNVRIFNESEEPVKMENINSETKLISILEVNGIKFTSKNFQIDFLLRQMMVLEKKPIFENCLIKINSDKKVDDLIDTINDEDTDHLEENTDDLEIAEPIRETKNIEDKSAEPVAEPVAKPVAEPVAKPVAKPVAEPVAEPVAKPVAEPVEDKNELSERGTLEKINNDDTLVEFDINENLNDLEKVHLKNPKEVYYEIYKEAKSKARQAKLYAINAIFEANQIKKTYNLDDFAESSDDETPEFN